MTTWSDSNSSDMVLGLEGRTLCTTHATITRWFVVLMFLAVVGCGGSSTSSDGPNDNNPPEKLTVVFEDMGMLSAQQTAITTIVNQAFLTVDDALSLVPIEIIVSADSQRVVPGWGMAGYTLSPNTIELVFDPQHPNLDALLPDRVPYIVAHELHHTARWNSQGVYETLLEALVFEGMADDFALEIIDGPTPPWTNAFPEEDTTIYFERALPQLDNSVSFDRWFFGVNTDLPRWTGYTLGLRLVQRYRLDNTNATSDQLAQTPAHQFRDYAMASGNGFIALEIR